MSRRDQPGRPSWVPIQSRPCPPPPWMSTIGYGLVTSGGASHSTYMGARTTVPHGPSTRSAPTQKKPRREVTGSPNGSNEGTNRLLVVVVGDRLEPFGRPDGDREVQQERIRRAAVPMALPGRDMGHVAGLEQRAMAGIGPQQPAPVGGVEDLGDAVTVPVGPGRRREEDAVDHKALVDEDVVG